MAEFLSKTQREELLAELRIERERKFADRIRVILLIDDGQKYQDIAKFLFLDETTVSNWKKRYKEGGIEKLVNDHYMGRISLLDDRQIKFLRLELDSKIYPTTQAVIDFVEKQFGIIYTLGGMTSLMHRLGFSYKKPKGVPAKADAGKQQKFLRRYRGIKPHGRVYFADSTHPMLNPILASGWIRKGREFGVKTNSGRQRININGAVDIRSMDVISRTCKTVNQAAMRDLIRAIRRKNPAEKHIYLVLDNASYNRAKSVQNLAKYLKVKIIYLPPYSPNLNPIERLWKFMKKKIMANQHYENLDEYRAALLKFFRGIKKYRNELDTLLTDNFQTMPA